MEKCNGNIQTKKIYMHNKANFNSEMKHRSCSTEKT